MFHLNKYTAKPPVLSDRAVGLCVGGGGGGGGATEKKRRERWNERANQGGG